ncbi:MAG: CinA family protein [Dehalococcoidia bacterium]
MPPTFLTNEQYGLAEAIAAALIRHDETIAVSDGTTGGLISAALLAVPGASSYYRGGGVLYTLRSRIALAGMPAEAYADYRGTTPEMLADLAEALRVRLDATWAIAESGLAGPTGGRSGAAPGRTTVAIAGPRPTVEVHETGSNARTANMSAFTTIALRLLRDTIQASAR